MSKFLFWCHFRFGFYEFLKIERLYLNFDPLPVDSKIQNFNITWKSKISKGGIFSIFDLNFFCWVIALFIFLNFFQKISTSNKNGTIIVTDLVFCMNIDVTKTKLYSNFLFDPTSGSGSTNFWKLILILYIDFNPLPVHSEVQHLTKIN